MTENLVAKSSVTIEAPGKDVWNALLDPQAVERYMSGARVTSSFTVGSPITWTGEWEGKRYEDRGIILELEPEKKLSYSHVSGSSVHPGGTPIEHKVTIWLESDGDHTRVDLQQDGNASLQARDRAEANWARILAGLKEYAEEQYAHRRLGSAAS
jgi:uncharacterized protein YndB with AHSA1/START domain